MKAADNFLHHSKISQKLQNDRHILHWRSGHSGDLGNGSGLLLSSVLRTRQRFRGTLLGHRFHSVSVHVDFTSFLWMHLFLERLMCQDMCTSLAVPEANRSCNLEIRAPMPPIFMEI